MRYNRDSGHGVNSSKLGNNDVREISHELGIRLDWQKWLKGAMGVSN